MIVLRQICCCCKQGALRSVTLWPTCRLFKMLHNISDILSDCRIQYQQTISWILSEVRLLTNVMLRAGHQSRTTDVPALRQAHCWTASQILSDCQTKTSIMIMIVYKGDAAGGPPLDDYRCLSNMSDTLSDRQTKRTSVMVVYKGGAAGGPPADDYRCISNMSATLSECRTHTVRPSDRAHQYHDCLQR